MTRLSKDELAREYETAMAWLDTLDPASTEVEDTEDLRRIGRAIHDIAKAEDELRTAVDRARAGGNSWAMIGLVLGVSKQAAQQRFGRLATSPPR